MSSTTTIKHVRNQLLVDAAGEQGGYTGYILLDGSNLPHGPNGDMRYQNGRRYLGDWNYGQWHSTSTSSTTADTINSSKAWFPNGDIYQGEYRHDKRHGHGCYTWKDGRKYTGTFTKDVRHGQGVYMWKDGTTTYTGTFHQGQRQGHGRYEFSGGTYVGEFERGQYHGQGECAWDDGRKYKGEWQDGMVHGQGVETDGLGKILHNGMWQHDEPLASANISVAVKSTTLTVKTLFDGFPKLPTIFSPSSKQCNAIVVEHRPDPPIAVDDNDKLEPVVNKLLVDAQGRRGNFRGMVLRGVPHGVGHMEYESSSTNKEIKGDTYQGFWDFGDWKEGRVDYQNGDSYHGDFGNLNVRSGKGQYLWTNGRQYQGEWHNDARHGQGHFHYPNGDYFQGTFSHGMRHGHGRFEFHDGSLFEGGFQKGQFHGQGCKYVHRDGRVYLGDFMDGARNGYGKESYPNGGLRYEGEWGNDEPLQPTKIQSSPPGFVLQDDIDDDEASELASLTSETSKTPSIVNDTKDCTTVVEEVVKDAQGNPGTFTGLVLRGLPHGVGRMVYTGEIREGFWKNGYLKGHARAFFANGDFYEGMFTKSQRQGKGVYKWKDGRIYEGDYIDDQRHGSGRFVYPSGDKYVGDYDLGMRSGMGKFTFADGSNYEGGWYDSLYHGYGELKEVAGTYYKGEWKEGKKHGTGQQYNEKERLLQKGEWEDDNFIKGDESVVVTDEKSSIGEASEREAKDLVESPRVRKQTFRWGSFEGENRRWEPSEAVLIQEDSAETSTLQQSSENKKIVASTISTAESELSETTTTAEEDSNEKVDAISRGDTLAATEESVTVTFDKGTSQGTQEPAGDSLPTEDYTTPQHPSEEIAHLGVPAAEKESELNDTPATAEEDSTNKIDKASQCDTPAVEEDSITVKVYGETLEPAEDSFPTEEDAIDSKVAQQPSKDDGDWLKVNESSKIP